MSGYSTERYLTDNDSRTGRKSASPGPGAVSVRRRKSRAGTRKVTSLTAEQLERKRANDREAQRTIRQRTKEHIECLERQVAELSIKGDQMDKLLQYNTMLEDEIVRLRQQVVTLSDRELKYNDDDAYSSSVLSTISSLGNDSQGASSIPQTRSVSSRPTGVIRSHWKSASPTPSSDSLSNQSPRNDMLQYTMADRQMPITPHQHSGTPIVQVNDQMPFGMTRTAQYSSSEMSQRSLFPMCLNGPDLHGILPSTPAQGPMQSMPTMTLNGDAQLASQRRQRRQAQEITGSHHQFIGKRNSRLSHLGSEDETPFYHRGVWPTQEEGDDF